ncbi:hypothetical protein [Deinococcus hopiensis]|uniref:Uncharacterized protein n=1 Tax=Deinococcus hopiensis KR-140 TaxID=695939 RepID=A0A1W1UX48_9DEIO|nr:hypothetical protein [Deinococcus hopiensis]SMB85718.1 hypothetical protein SAMN00790413_03516 [Deinococcus hopiensis KR-140]
MGLESDPFSTQITKDGIIRISRQGRVVVTLGGDRAARLRKALENAADEHARQQLLARATGNYRRGNERHT